MPRWPGVKWSDTWQSIGSKGSRNCEALTVWAIITVTNSHQRQKLYFSECKWVTGDGYFWGALGGSLGTVLFDPLLGFVTEGDESSKLWWNGPTYIAEMYLAECNNQKE